MYIESHYLAHRTVRKRHHIVYVIISLILMLLISIDMGLKNWFTYCWWEFGLIHASSITTFTNLDNESTISDVDSDACQAIRNLVESNCPDFCNYITKFQIGGVFMVLLSSISLVFHAISISFHIWSSFKVAFKFKKISIFMVLPGIFYALGVIIYSGSVNPLNIRSPNDKIYNASTFSMKSPFILSYVLVPLNAFLAVYGLLKTRIAFTEANI